jgi:hypothetical protein
MEIPTDRDVTAAFHLAAGSQWLMATDEGRNSNALAYCGFEFRLALERVALELLLHIRRNEELTDTDIKAMSKVGNMRNRIYALVGHQQKINRQVEFMNIILEALKQSFRISSVDLGKLSRYWSDCSELCHMQISKEYSWDREEGRQSAYKELLDIKAFLQDAIQGLTWFSTYDYAQDLLKRYVEGLVTKDEILNKFRETGIYATLTMPDGTVQTFPGFEPGSHIQGDD